MNYDPDLDDSNLSRQPTTGCEPQAQQQRFALIDLNSGYVWYVLNADSAADACTEANFDINGTARTFAEVSRSEANTTGGGYAVHLAPRGYVCCDGQLSAEIEHVQTMPLAGYYRAKQVEG